MSPLLFADAIMHDKVIKVFNNGNMGRDFTYLMTLSKGLWA
jgi:UDP-glucuronate 4-epimerase